MLYVLFVSGLLIVPGLLWGGWWWFSFGFGALILVLGIGLVALEEPAIPFPKREKADTDPNVTSGDPSTPNGS